MRLATPLIVAAALLVSAAPAYSAGLVNTPGLQGITVRESTFTDLPYSWPRLDTALLTRLPGTLGPGNADFTGSPSEFYDVFYSDANGNLDPLGDFLTVECDDLDLNDTGCNIAEVELVFGTGTAPVHACGVTSFFAAGPQAVLFSPPLAADGNLLSWCTLGSNFGAGQRLHITFGFCGPTSAQGSTWGRLKSLYR